MRALKRRSSSSSSLKESLPPELWMEIFARMPSKTLLRFRSVCKTWCSLIDSPDFISLHLKLCPINSKKINLLLLENLVISRDNSLVYKIRRRDNLRKIAQLVINLEFYMVYGTDMVDGLMLMENSCFCFRDLSLWNPSIKKSLLLPPCPLLSMPDKVRFCLGFSPSSFDYKVIAFHSVNSANGELSIAVYSLHDRVWSVKLDRMNVPSWCFQRIMAGYGVLYSQGAVYWRPFQSTGHKEETHLLCFEFDAEKFSFVELPDAGEKMLRFLFLLGDSLAVFGISQGKSCIWVMDKDAGKVLWRQPFSGDSTLDSYEFFGRFVNSSTKFLYFEKTGTFLLQRDKKLMSYNITSHNITSHQLQHLGKAVHCLYVDMCVDSLVLGVAQRS